MPTLDANILKTLSTDCPDKVRQFQIKDGRITYQHGGESFDLTDAPDPVAIVDHASFVIVCKAYNRLQARMAKIEQLSSEVEPRLGFESSI